MWKNRRRRRNGGARGRTGEGRGLRMEDILGQRLNRQLDHKEAAILVGHHHWHHLYHGGEGLSSSVQVWTVEHPVHHLLLLHLNVPLGFFLVVLLTRHVVGNNRNCIMRIARSQCPSWFLFGRPPYQARGRQQQELHHADCSLSILFSYTLVSSFSPHLLLTLSFCVLWLFYGPSQ